MSSTVLVTGDTAVSTVDMVIPLAAWWKGSSKRNLQFRGVGLTQGL